LAEFMN